MAPSGSTTRADFLKLGAGAGAAMLTGAFLKNSRAFAASALSEGTTLNWLTWDDHYLPQQIAKVKTQTGIKGNPILFIDDQGAYLKLRQGGAHYDMCSADALWVTKDFHDGLVTPFDLASIAQSKGLFSVAKNQSFWKANGGYLTYPKGWSMSIIYYNPKYVTTKPDSWHALLDPKYKGKVIFENSATALMADAGVAIGSKHPTNMTKHELSLAVDYLKQLKPNILKFAAQGDELVRALADESAWIGIEWLGTEDRVKAAGGPVVKAAIPKEGTTGWIDGEMLVKSSPNHDSFITFVNAMETPQWTAQLFLKNGHPMLNEKTYKVLVNMGQKERADRALYNQPDKYIPTLNLWGPAQNQQAYTDAYNEVFA